MNNKKQNNKHQQLKVSVSSTSPAGSTGGHNQLQTSIAMSEQSTDFMQQPNYFEELEKQLLPHQDKLRQEQLRQDLLTNQPFYDWTTRQIIMPFYTAPCGFSSNEQNQPDKIIS